MGNSESITVPPSNQELVDESTIQEATLLVESQQHNSRSGHSDPIPQANKSQAKELARSGFFFKAYLCIYLRMLLHVQVYPVEKDNWMKMTLPRIQFQRHYLYQR